MSLAVSRTSHRANSSLSLMPKEGSPDPAKNVCLVLNVSKLAPMPAFLRKLFGALGRNHN